MSPPFIKRVVGWGCLRRLWVGAIHRDGSQDAEFSTVETPFVVQNEDPLRETERALRAGDEREIARQMRAINAVGARHGIKVVFIVPPVYETDRHDSIVNQIFSGALALVPDIAVIDHRGMRSNTLSATGRWYVTNANERRHRCRYKNRVVVGRRNRRLVSRKARP
jgi:hypothetical protein